MGAVRVVGNGPYEDEAQAIAAARPILDLEPGKGLWQPACLAALEGACAGAGVALDAYDRRVLEWFAGMEPQVRAVIAGLIRRAGNVMPSGYLGVFAQALTDAHAYRVSIGDGGIGQAGLYRKVAQDLGVPWDITDPPLADSVTDWPKRGPGQRGIS
jgi:hypothetical protein